MLKLFPSWFLQHNPRNWGMTWKVCSPMEQGMPRPARAENKRKIRYCSGCFELLGDIRYRVSLTIRHAPERLGGTYVFSAIVCSSACAKSVIEEEHARVERDKEEEQSAQSTQAEPIVPEVQPVSIITDTQPSQEKRDVWIHAFCPSMMPHEENDERQAEEYVGKWLIFRMQPSIDEAWARVKSAVEQGRLWRSAKASTIGSRQAQKTRKYVICVYTPDYRDEADVMRIRQVLRELGFTEKLYYKTDEDTLAGRYSGTGYIPTYSE